VEPDAREAAKRAARSAGMTLGAWLNQKLLEGEGANVGAPTVSHSSSQGYRTSETPPLGLGFRAERPDARASSEIGAVGHSLDALQRQLDRSENRAERTYDQVSRSLEAMLARLDDASARRRTDTGEGSEGLHTIRNALSDVSQRLTAVETRRDPERDVRDMERALSEMSRALDTTNSRAAQRIDQVERSLDKVADRTERRDDRRMDAIRGLERAVTEVVGRLDETNRHQSDAARETDRAIAGLRSEISQPDNSLAPSIDLLRERIFELSEQLDASRTSAPRTNAEETLTAIERRIADALENTARAEDLVKLEARVEASEVRNTEAVQELKSEIIERLGGSEKERGTPMIGHNAPDLSEFEERISARFEKLSSQLDYLSDDIDTRIDQLGIEARTEIETLRDEFGGGTGAPRDEPLSEPPPQPVFEEPAEQEPEVPPAHAPHDDTFSANRNSLRDAASRTGETGVFWVDRDDDNHGVRASIALFVILLMLVSVGMIGYSGWRLWSNGQLDLPFLAYILPDRAIEVEPIPTRPMEPAPAEEVIEPEPDPVEDGREDLPEQNVRMEPRDEPDTVATDPAPARAEPEPDPDIATARPTETTPATIASLQPGADTLYAESVTLFEAGSNTEEAAALMIEAAEMGLTIAEFRAGMLYEAGHGVPQNIELARNWYERAAEGGNARAMHNLAVLYAEGSVGGAPDFSQAARWFAEAAAYDIRDSQYNLAVLFETGQGVRQDLRQAYLWYTIAARSGDTEAATRKVFISDRLDDDVRGRINAAAERWQPRVPDAEANGQLSVSRPLGPTTAQIARTQYILGLLGYAPGPPDGIMGPTTAESIREFQRTAGLAVTGRVTSELITRLEIALASRASGG